MIAADQINSKTLTLKFAVVITIAIPSRYNPYRSKGHISIDLWQSDGFKYVWDPSLKRQRLLIFIISSYILPFQFILYFAI